MSEPSEKTLKRLFALSGNICAFPGCSLPLVESTGTVTGELAHIKARNSLGPRFDKNQNESARHSFENLILLCRHHHKVIDSEAAIYTAEVLSEMKAVHENVAGRPELLSDGIFAKILLNGYRNIVVHDNSGNVAINSPGAILGKVINLKTTHKKVTISAPPGTIGADPDATRYTQHLIKRYNEFASKNHARTTRFGFGAISKNIVSNFGSEWRLLQIERAPELFAYLQGRILRTKQAKINKGRGHRAFSTFEKFKSRSGDEDT